MRFLFTTAFCLHALLMPSAADADNFDTVQDVLPDCEAAAHSDFDDYGSFYCLGLAAGVGAVSSYNCYSQADGDRPNPLLSSDGEVTNGARIQAFVNWARAHPEHWSLDATTGMIVALNRTFPCN